MPGELAFRAWRLRERGSGTLAHVEQGKLPSLDRLRARPGWSDILDGEKFLAERAQALRIRAVLNEGAPVEMTGADRKFRERYGHLPINQPWAQTD